MVGGCHVKPEQFFNLIFGYNDRYVEEIIETNAAVGWNDLLGTQVPEGEVWVVTALSGTNWQRACTIQLGVRAATIDTYAVSGTSPGAALWYSVSGLWVMKKDDRIVGSYGGCIAGDDIKLRALGYKMKISQ